MPKFDKFEFGRRLRAARKSARLTQEALGDSMGVSGASVAQYEKGDNLPSLDKLALACAALRVSADSLLQLSDAPARPRGIMESAADLPEPVREALLQIVSHLASLNPSERRYYKHLEEARKK